jgi:hypothetical protein
MGRRIVKYISTFCASTTAFHKSKKYEINVLILTKVYMKWYWIEAQMTSVTSYRCGECDTVFDSQQELIQHEIYARYRRPGICWQ